MAIDLFLINLMKPVQNSRKSISGGISYEEKSWNTNSFLPICNLNYFNSRMNISFQGCGHRGKLPANEVINRLNKAITNIREAKNDADKCEIFDEEFYDAPRWAFSIWLEMNKDELSETEIEILRYDFMHEIHHPLQEIRYTYIFESQNDNIPLNSDVNKKGEPRLNFYKKCDEAIKEVEKVFERYQVFLDEGLFDNEHKMSEILSISMDAVKKNADDKNITLIVSGEEHLANPSLVSRVNNYDLYTVLYNVLHNAVKYSPPNNKVNLEISTGKNKEGIPVLNFAVTNKGMGISKGEVVRVLNGNRTQEAIESNISGTGYGLRRVNEILKSAKSHVDIESPVYHDSPDGPGTKIICPVPLGIKLPIKEAENLFREALCRIRKEDTPEGKAAVCKNAIKRYRRLDKSWYSSVEQYLSPDIKLMVSADLGHESGAGLHSILNHDIAMFRLCHKPLPSDFDDVCKKAFFSTINTYKRYQFFLDKDLACNDKSIGEIFKLALESVEHKAQDMGINFEIIGERLLEDSDIKIYSLKNYTLYTIFSNLLQNAVKYSPKNGKIKINVALDDDKKGHKLINFSVQDNGIGISPKKVNKIGTKGYRTEEAVKSGIPGTGYGLYRVKKILEDIQSELIITSPVNHDAPGKPGTRVTCLIPIKRIEQG